MSRMLYVQIYFYIYFLCHLWMLGVHELNQHTNLFVHAFNIIILVLYIWRMIDLKYQRWTP